METAVRTQPTDTLQRIQYFLAGRFPNVEFFPKIIRYPGGQSLLLSWTDGPEETDLKFFVDLHKGASLSADGIVQPIETLLSLPNGGNKIVQSEFEFIMLRRYLTLPDERKDTSKLKFI